MPLASLVFRRRRPGGVNEPISQLLVRAREPAGVRQPMSAVGGSADNALPESINASFKRETLQGRRAFTDEREARLNSLRWLHHYNVIRRHCRLGQQSPVTYENYIQNRLATLASAT